MACFLNALPDNLCHVGKLTNAKSVLICKQLCKPSIWLLQGMHVPTCGVLYIMLLTQSYGEYVVTLQLSGYIQLEILNCCAYNLLFNVLPVVFFIWINSQTQNQYLLGSNFTSLLFVCCRQEGSKWRACGAWPGISRRQERQRPVRVCQLWQPGHQLCGPPARGANSCHHPGTQLQHGHGHWP